MYPQWDTHSPQHGQGQNTKMIHHNPRFVRGVFMIRKMGEDFNQADAANETKIGLVGE